MLQLFLEIWYSLPIGWRRLLTALPAVVCLVIAAVRWDWVPLAIGAAVSFILLLLPGPSQAEKNGYHF